VRALSRFRSAALPALPELIRLLDDPDPVIRWNAARTLGKIGPKAKDAVPHLVKALGQADVAVREHAAEALGDIGPEAQAAIPDLIRVLDDKEPKVRRDAARSLGLMGTVARSAVPALKGLLKDPQEMVRDAAQKALYKVDPEGQLPKPPMSFVPRHSVHRLAHHIPRLWIADRKHADEKVIALARGERHNLLNHRRLGGWGLKHEAAGFLAADVKFLDGRNGQPLYRVHQSGLNKCRELGFGSKIDRCHF
jgi:HEAT repeat protein